MSLSGAERQLREEVRCIVLASYAFHPCLEHGNVTLCNNLLVNGIAFTLLSDFSIIRETIDLALDVVPCRIPVVKWRNPKGALEVISGSLGHQGPPLDHAAT